MASRSTWKNPSLLCVAALVLVAAEPKPVEPAILELRGRIVCLAEEVSRQHGVALPTNHAHLLGFKTTNSTCYTLLRVKTSEALFADKRLQEKELLLTGRVFPKTQVLEVTRMKSIVNGVVNDLFYFCDICTIVTISPEICLCCQGPVELIERPLKAK